MTYHKNLGFGIRRYDAEAVECLANKLKSYLQLGRFAH